MKRVLLLQINQLYAFVEMKFYYGLKEVCTTSINQDRKKKKEKKIGR